MPCVGFEPTIPVSERAKTVHALDRSATVTGLIPLLMLISNGISPVLVLLDKFSHLLLNLDIVL
jgi:hypothetical protein